jgi:hypothetical protein
MAKAMNSPIHTILANSTPKRSPCEPKSFSVASLIRLKVCVQGLPSISVVGLEAKYRAIIASSISTEPARV